MFKPTYLYLKKHRVTGLLYFGKTTKKDPEKYNGSGKYWSSHLRKHGNEIQTIWFKLFVNEDECVNFSKKFSQKCIIHQSEKFANLIIENGLDGRPVGSPNHIQNAEERISKRLKMQELWSNEKYKTKMRAIHKERYNTAKGLQLREKYRDTDRLNTLEARLKSTQSRTGGTTSLKGSKQSIEHKRKRSDALKGVPKTSAHKDNMCLNAKDREWYHNPFTKQRIHPKKGTFIPDGFVFGKNF